MQGFAQEYMEDGTSFEEMAYLLGAKIDKELREKGLDCGCKK
jgi:hypothetical protein